MLPFLHPPRALLTTGLCRQEALGFCCLSLTVHSWGKGPFLVHPCSLSWVSVCWFLQGRHFSSSTEPPAEKCSLTHFIAQTVFSTKKWLSYDKLFSTDGNSSKKLPSLVGTSPFVGLFVCLLVCAVSARGWVAAIALLQAGQHSSCCDQRSLGMHEVPACFSCATNTRAACFLTEIPF